MRQQDEKKWRSLCDQAISEHDPNKLLSIFLALDHAIEQEQQTLATQSVPGMLIKAEDLHRKTWKELKELMDFVLLGNAGR